MENVVETPLPSAETPPVAPSFVEFTGRRWALFKLVLKNTLLNIVTIGIYRFWAKTRVRRYFWSNIVIGGEPLKYTGRGLEMFIGFLIVLAVLVPLALLQAGIELLASAGSPVLPVLANVVYVVVFLFLIQFALFRMWRYRLTRTRWRGIRLGLDGSAFRYSIRAFLWFLFQGVTLGVASPWAAVDLMRYKLRRTRYGDTAFGFDGSGKALLVPWLIAWGIPVILGIVGMIGMSDLWIGLFNAASQGLAPPPMDFSAWAGLLVLAGLMFPFMSIWYQIRAFRYLIGCVRFGDATFTSGMRFGKILLIYLLAGVLFMVLAGLIFAAFVGVGVVFETASAFAAFFPLLLILLLILLMPLVIYPFMVFPIIRHVWTTVTVGNPEAFDRAARATTEAPKFGEGLADAFDVGAI